MKKKKLSIAATTILSLSLLVPSFYPAGTKNVEALKGVDPFVKPASPAVDLGVANDERLIEMLKKSGKIPAKATPGESEKLLQVYLKSLSKVKPQDSSVSLQTKKSLVKNEKLGNLANGGIINGKGNKFGQTKDPVSNVQKETWSGGVKKDNILVLLIEFPDFPHNKIQPNETGMYYQDYTKQHYQDMIFGSNGYKGPNGEPLMSMKQYYEEQSGGSYTISGTVGGWYQAPKEAAYYGQPSGGSNDARPRSLVAAALRSAALDPAMNLKDYDLEDPYDIDEDGNKNEPDGIIDHLMVVHSSVGEEAGGGQLGENAIWSHSWDLGGVYPIPNTSTDVKTWGGLIGAYDYTIEPADGATGVFAHEFGHDLGLPDEYDTIYSGSGDTVEYWSIMSSGSWAGKVPGTEPTSFSPYGREMLQNIMPEGNWMSGSVVNLSDVPKAGLTAFIDQATSKGKNNDVVRVNLPDKSVKVNTPYSGTSEYFSTKGDNVNTSMSKALDLTGASSATLKFKTWYDIEQDYDYASVQVSTDGGNTFNTVKGNITTTVNPYGGNPGDGITGSSNGKWVDGEFDLSAYAGKNVILSFNYVTDAGVALAGFYVDDIVVQANQGVVLQDNVDQPQFVLNGFKTDTGSSTYTNYYLLEWRNQQGADQGLAHIRRNQGLMSYDGGLVVWYVDNSYSDNWTGMHPGRGYLSVVDGDQNGLKWSDGGVASTRYQVHDAAFSLARQQKLYVDYTNVYGIYMKDYNIEANTLFSDSLDYSNRLNPEAGVLLPKLGLKVRVTGESADRSVGKILLYK